MIKIDAAYVINLKARTDRWEHFQAEQKFLNLPVKRFNAIDGKTCGIHPAIPPYPGWTVMSYGNLGNVLSQRAILEEAKKNKYDNVLILEDDVEFDKTANIDKFLDKVPYNWDMIYFGGNHMTPLLPINKTVGKCVYTLTAHAILIRNTMYDKLLEVTKGLWAPIDLYYSLVQTTNNVYAPLQPIAWQIAGYSDIEEKHVDYSQYLL